MTRKKSDSVLRRTIVDLSWPENFLVNAGTQKNMYLFIYPFADDNVEKIIEFGSGSLLYKVDIRRVLRQFKLDLGDLDLLGLIHLSYFTDQ